MKSTMSPAKLAKILTKVVKDSGLESDFSFEAEDFIKPRVETPAEIARRKKQEKEQAAYRREQAKKAAYAKTPQGKLDAALAKISTLETQKVERDKAQALDMTIKQRELREMAVSRDNALSRASVLVTEVLEQKALVKRLLDLIEKVLSPPTKPEPVAAK